MIIYFIMLRIKISLIHIEPLIKILMVELLNWYFYILFIQKKYILNKFIQLLKIKEFLIL